MSYYSLSQARILGFIGAGIAFIAAALTAVKSGVSAPVYLDIILGVIFLYVSISMSKITSGMNETEKALEAACGGDLNMRLLNVNEKHKDVQHIMHKINEFLDLTEAFLRETDGAMTAIMEGRTYRRMIETGMPGIFLRFTKQINGATIVAEEARKGFMKLTDDFEAKALGMAESLAGAAEELQATSSEMSRNADLTLKTTGDVRKATESAAENVQSMASAAEELSSSINEIASRTSEASQQTQTAVATANNANDQVKNLEQAADKIGDVVNLITDIAEQTNLLALNATIEAARAGDAGKGFAVVASEVKSLAAQTATATQEIEEQIRSIQEQTKTAVGAIEEIGQIVADVNEGSNTIAAAVEEQNVTTQEIARNIQAAVQSMDVVTQATGIVNDAAAETGTGATQVQEAANDVAKQASGLNGEVNSYIARAREQ